VTVRHPHSLSHLVEAMKSAGDRDVVVLAVRVLGAGVDDESAEGTTPTRDERYLFAQVVALTERYARPVRLLIVPAAECFRRSDPGGSSAPLLRSLCGRIVDTAHLRTGALLGEAWDHAAKDEDQKLRLVICHHSGRTDAYHLGAHPPSLPPVISNGFIICGATRCRPSAGTCTITTSFVPHLLLWNKNFQAPSARKRWGSYVKLQDLQTSWPPRFIPETIRDCVICFGNRHASDVAQILTDLGVEDQVIVFRIMPRKDAAAVFEYLSLEEQEALLKAMAHEDVATLLNSMAPDDRHHVP